MRVTVNTIENEDDYEAALDELSELIDLDPATGTPEGARLDVIGALVDAYEEEHFPIPDPDPIEAIRFRLEQQGLDESDLVGIIGTVDIVLGDCDR